VADAFAGRSRVAVLRGEAGVGKSALLGYLSTRVEGWCVARAAGVESEMELAYAGLHQLCAPLLDHLGRLPGPQRDALATVFGLSSGAAPDRFLVGLATLTLLAEVAEQQPLACIVDDGQWLDQASAQVLGFVARRLLAERIAVVCAARPGPDGDVLAGLPEIPVSGLADGDARALLLASIPGPIDAAVCDQIVMESHGNPLALLELPRTWDVAGFAGGFGLPGGQPVTGRIEQSYVRRLRLLPADTQLLVLTAAAEPLGDRLLLHRAAGTLGIDPSAAAPAQDAGLLDIGGRVEFAHPLVRSAAYRSAAPSDRYRAHRALADATMAETDPDRRAWHRARATSEPDEEVAAELERSAGRAQARGGVAAAAAFLQRSAELTADPARRARRALAAAQASAQAGAFETAAGLLAMAEGGPPDERLGADVDLLRGQIAFASGAASDAVSLLLRAARRFEPIDLDLARETYLDACQAAQIAGHLAHGVTLDEVCRAARDLPPPPHPPRPADLLLDGLTRLVIDGPAAAAPVLRRATSAFAAPEVPVAQRLRWGWMTPMAGASLWDYGGYSLVEGPVKLAREVGALDRLPMLLNQVADAAVWRGDLTAAASLIAEADAVCEVTGARVPPYAALMLAAYRGREAEAVQLIKATVERATAAGQGAVVTWAHWAAMRLYNGLGRYPDVLAAARQISENEPAHTRVRPLTELVEAAARVGDLDLARDAHRRLAEWTRVGGTSWGQGIEARCRALITDGQAAEPLYQAAIEHYRGTQLRPSLARARLLYGEWLRREGRRLDARDQLRSAHHQFEESGMEAYAERARRELLATGEKTRRRSLDTREELTPQEAQIVRLAADGHTNAEIAAQLFLSVRTVEWHLRKVFTKLGVSSRRELRTALAQQAPTRSA
jgi:DNA-binding CsgD family transcriptional regulator